MGDIIKFGYGSEYAVGGNFNLNTLRELRKVESVGGKYLLEKAGKGSEITIEINQDIIVDEDKIDQEKLNKAIKDADQLRTWWLDEQTAHNKLKEKLAAITAVKTEQEV